MSNKNLNKVLLIGAVLAEGSINVNSSSFKSADSFNYSVTSSLSQDEIFSHTIVDFLKHHSNAWHGQFDISMAAISFPLPCETPEALISKENWISDVFLKQIFMEQYDKLKKESIKEFSFGAFKGVIFDGKLFETGKNDIMQYCKREYQKKLQALEIIQDIKNTLEFISNILTEKSYDFVGFLCGGDTSRVFVSLNDKMNACEILSGEKEYLELRTLTSPERKLLVLSFILQKLCLDGNKACSVALQTLKSSVKDLDFEEFISSCVNLNPYYFSLSKVGITTLSFSDYDRFFNYDNLIDFYILLYTLRYLKSSSIAGDMGIIIDNLRVCINNCISNGHDKTNPELFAKFIDLQNELALMEE